MFRRQEPNPRHQFRSPAWPWEGPGASPAIREPRPEHSSVGGREPRTWAADRLRTASRCCSAMTSKCSEAR